jgi:hypothetical protein
MPTVDPATLTPPAPAPAPTPTTSTTTTTPAPAPGDLSAAEQQIAQQQGIQATRANFDAFMNEAKALEAENALGPGSTDGASITELQQLLAGFGYNVQQNGQFDDATVAAVLQFKKDAGLKASYVMADGSPAYHPFIDAATKQAMIAKLQAATPATPATPTTTSATPAAPATTTTATTTAPAPATPPDATAPTATTSGTGTDLSADALAMCQQQGILATQANFTAFMNEAQALEAQDAIGPGAPAGEAITELQQLLSTWGYTVQATGQWDDATTAAVLQFKKDNGLKASYVMADGSPGYNPFIDSTTKQAMITKLQGANG